MRARLRIAVFMAIVALPATARVVRIQVEKREPFDASSNYEKLTGRAFGELDSRDPLNAIITDLNLAPRNFRGLVDYSATFTLLLPIDRAKLSGVLIYEVPNRGNSPLNSRRFNDDMTTGHALLSSGWQADVEERPRMETIRVPIVRNLDGSPVIGPVMVRLSNLPPGLSTAQLTTGYGGLRYQRPAVLDTVKALLTKQASDDGELIPIPPTEWAFADCSRTPFPGEPDPAKICVKRGFDSNLLYRLVYTAKDPLVLGIGIAATRDIVSFFRRSEDESNPLARRIQYALAFGTSQSGNFLKTFLNLGFNQDEDKRIVWDGIDSHIAGRQTPLNVRFGIPGGATGLYEPGSEGVLWWSDYRDDLRGRPAAGLLDRCRASHTCPKIFETFGSTEFWGLRMSPDLVGTKADVDIPLPPEVRRYYFRGVTHGGSNGGFSTTAASPTGWPCTLAPNPNSMNESMRALRRALIEWVTKGAPPPASVYPRLDRGELVAADHASMAFPLIPGKPLPDNMLNRLPIYDFGPEFRYNDLSGAIAAQPPPIRGAVPMLVPRTDPDGNEASGIASPLHQAPLGTYLGWNVTASGYLKGRTCGFAGGFIPFARTKAEREAAGDPRLSLEERYGTHEEYVAKVKAAAGKLVEQKFLLEDDAARLVREAEASNVLR